MWQAETSSGCEVPWIEKGSPQAGLPESTGRHSGKNCPARECLRRDTGPEAGRPSNRPERLHSPVSSACQVTGTARGTPPIHHRGTEKGDGEKPTKSATRFHHRDTEDTKKGDTDQTSNRQEHNPISPQRHKGHREKRQPQNSNRQGRGRGEALEQGRPEPHGTCPVENTRPHVGHWGPEDTPAGAGLPDRGRASPGLGPILAFPTSPNQAPSFPLPRTLFPSPRTSPTAARANSAAAILGSYATLRSAQRTQRKAKGKNQHDPAEKNRSAALLQFSSHCGVR